MYGSEQASIEGSSIQRRLATRLFGVIHMGVRLRFWSNLTASKGLLNGEPLDILEVGSDNGALAFWLASREPKHNVMGLEIDAGKVRLATRLRDKLGLDRVEFIQGDASEPFKLPKRFNLVYSTHVLEHIENDSAALANMYDALNDGGTLILQVPRKVSESLSDRDIEGGHHRRYTYDELLNKMEGTGFRDVRVGGCRGRLGSLTYELDRKLASIKGPLHLNGVFFPILLLLGYVDHLTTKNPQHGGLIAIGRRG